MKKLLIAAVLLAATTAHADGLMSPDMIIQNSLQSGYQFQQGYNNGQRMREAYERREQEQESYARYQQQMLQIERQRNEIMEQQNRIQQYPQLYQFGYGQRR